VKIHLLSDLHLEFQDYIPQVYDIDVVVLAGDIGVGTKGIEWAIEYYPDTPIVYILGNHEYYKHAYPHLLAQIKEKNYPDNIHVLENDSVIIGDIRFIGATLWADFNLFGDPVLGQYMAQLYMNDYKCIRKSPEFRRLEAGDTLAIHNETVKWLTETLAASIQGQKQFVVTHHGPSMQSVPLRYRSELTSAAYSSNLEELLLTYQPDIYVHGHTHDSMDYLINNTRVLCNPRGYPGPGGNKNFNPNLIIEL
jgi:Icc-related predicted phosphoesterase